MQNTELWSQRIAEKAINFLLESSKEFKESYDALENWEQQELRTKLAKEIEPEL